MDCERGCFDSWAEVALLKRGSGKVCALRLSAVLALSRSRRVSSFGALLDGAVLLELELEVHKTPHATGLA